MFIAYTIKTMNRMERKCPPYSLSPCPLVGYYWQDISFRKRCPTLFQPWKTSNSSPGYCNQCSKVCESVCVICGLWRWRAGVAGAVSEVDSSRGSAGLEVPLGSHSSVTPSWTVPKLPTGLTPVYFIFSADMKMDQTKTQKHSHHSATGLLEWQQQVSQQSSD